jgi:hypothetical protein
MTEPLTGRCLCGAVRFVLSEPPLEAGYCHCTRCQRRTGTAASGQARVNGDALDVLAGEELVRWWRHEDGGFEKGFCHACGGHLFSRNPDDHSQHSVRMSAFDSDPGVRPSFRQWVASAARWESIPDDGLPRYDERRPPG